MKNNASGTAGENAAANYLLSRGYKISERNFRCRYGEIDIIAEKDGCIVFAEVKTRKTDAFGRPAEFVNMAKREKIRKTALVYTGDPDVRMRFDVIEILYEERFGEFWIKKINHIENAF